MAWLIDSVPLDVHVVCTWHLALDAVSFLNPQLFSAALWQCQLENWRVWQSPMQRCCPTVVGQAPLSFCVNSHVPSRLLAGLQ